MTPTCQTALVRTIGWLRVSQEDLTSDDDLSRWVDIGIEHARSLPPKQPASRKPRPAGRRRRELRDSLGERDRRPPPQFALDPLAGRCDVPDVAEPVLAGDLGGGAAVGVGLSFYSFMSVLKCRVVAHL